VKSWAHFFAARGAAKKPGFPLQFLVRASRALRDFRYYPLRAQGLISTLWTHFINKNNNLHPSSQAQPEGLPNCPQFGSSHHQ
jgi:hypothetical protein